MGFLGLLLAPNLAGAADLSVLAPAGPAARGIATLWWWMFWGAAAIFAGVMALFLLLLSRPEALRRTSPRLWLLGGGVVFPLPVVTVLTLAALVQGGTLLGDSLTGATPLRIEAEARMWEWRFRYPGTDMPETVNRLHLPVGRDVEIRVTSLDVIHSFWVPRLAGKLDAIPGHVNVLRIEADGPGEFKGVSAEFNGTGYLAHRFRVIAHDRRGHGRSSQLMLAGSNVLGSVISLTSNFIAGGALIAMLSPFSFSQGIAVLAGLVAAYFAHYAGLGVAPS